MIQKTPLKNTLYVLLLALVGAAPLNAQVLTDTFTSLDTTNTWEVYSSAGANDPLVGSGILTEAATVTSAAQRSLLISQGTGFNPFATALDIQLAGLTLNSGGLTTTGSNQFYVLVGLQESDPANLTPSGTYNSGNYIVNPTFYNAAGGGAFAISILANTTGVSLSIADYGSSNSTTSYDLNGLPTDLSITLDGAGGTYSVSVEGTTFTDGGSSTITGSISNFALSASSASKLVLGAINVGTVTSATVATLDSISIIPESNAAGAVSLVCLLLLCVRCRKRR
ncbi:hypothetical protein [Coraliomargarita parva]|uniref:hypothetical protein n=1 Tax=Coraliomargarita parva TaxID=3014050 RepID=UPI0022B423F6|nr:hypothetical protein [Coraliomargarita parva]